MIWVGWGYKLPRYAGYKDNPSFLMATITSPPLLAPKQFPECIIGSNGCSLVSVLALIASFPVVEAVGGGLLSVCSWTRNSEL